MSEVKKLPKGWEWVTLDKVCDKLSLNKIKIKQKDYLTDGKYAVIDQGLELIGGYYNDKNFLVPDEPPYIVFGDHTKIKKFVPFQFIPGADGVKVLKPKPNIDPKYLFYSLFTIKIEDKGYARHFQLLEKELFPFPSLQTQQAIVSKIEELFSEVDKGIENLRIAQQQLKTYRQSILKWAFEGKLTEEFRKKNIKKVKGSVPKVGTEPNGDLPKGWEWTTIGALCSGVEYGSATKSSVSGKVPVLRMGNIQNGRFDWEDLVYTSDATEIKKYLLKKNDVLFNRTNSAELVGKTAIYKNEQPAIFAGYLIRINRHENLLDGDYLNYFLNTHFARAYGNTVRSFGVNQSNINGTKLKMYPIPAPSVDEQRAVVEEIESRLSVADKMEESIATSLQQAEALKQSILKMAFEGRLVSEVKPTTEIDADMDYLAKVQILALVAKASKKKGIAHGEMTIAKYLYLLQEVFGIPTGYEFERWHLGPYTIEMKKVVNNNAFFKKVDNSLEVVNDKVLSTLDKSRKRRIESAVSDLATIFLNYPAKTRAHKTELLATVCKVVEDIKTTDLAAVRASMEEWKINLTTTKCKTKAEKFTEPETKKCLDFIIAKGWDKKLI